MFPSVYIEEKKKIADLISYDYNNEKSLEVLNLLKILTEKIATYPVTTTPDQYEDVDKDVVNNLILTDWELNSTTTWDPTNTVTWFKTSYVFRTATMYSGYTKNTFD